MNGATIAPRIGRIGAQLKSGPGSATNTVIPGPNHCEGVAMADHTAPSTDDALTAQIRASSMARTFWLRVRVPDTAACWTWAGARSGENEEYGYYDGMGAHRFSWVLANGPIPGGLFVRHRCDNPPCVNPAHLELGTHQQNMQDMIERRRGWHQNRTHCKWGHPLSPDTEMITPRGDRRCIVCAREAQKRRREQDRELVRCDVCGGEFRRGSVREHMKSVHPGMSNLTGARADSRSGVRGVTKTESGRYSARLKVDGKERRLGTFDSIEEASAAVQKATEERKGGR